MAAMLACLAVCVFSGCDDKKEGQPVIELSAPAADATIDLASSGNITFSWKKVEGVTAYTLKFASSEEALAESKAVKEVSDKVSYVLTAAEADGMMAQFTEVKPGATGTIYWTVVGGEAITQVRKMNIRRLPPRLEITPAAEVPFEAIPTAGATVEVKSNIDWAVTIEQTGSWLKASPAAGAADGSFTLTAEPNTATAERTATVTVSGEGVDAKTIVVTQAAGNGEALYLNVSPDVISFTAEPAATPQTVTVTSNAQWTATPSAAWLKAEKGEGVILLTAEANATASVRTATVTVEAPGVSESKTVTIMQAAAGSKFVTPSQTAVEMAYTATAGVGGSALIQVTSNTTWTVSIPDDAKSWLTAILWSADPEAVADQVTGKGRIQIDVQQNIGSERTAAITITGEGVEPQTITVKQLSATAKLLTLSQDKMEFDHRSNQSYIEVTSNTAWSASIPASASWLTARFLDSEGMAVTAPVEGDGTLLLEATANTGEARTATITVSGEGAASKTITVTQAKNPPPYLNASVDNVIPANGDMTTFLRIDANVDWSIEIPAAAGWLTPNKTSGEAGNSDIQLIATENTGETDRSTVITITGEGVTPQTVTVTQRGNRPYIEVDQHLITDGFYMGEEAGTFGIPVRSNTVWNAVSGDPAWLQVSKQLSADSNNGQIDIKVTENTTTAERTATITISGEGAAPVTFTVKQGAKQMFIDLSTYNVTFAATPAGPVTVDITANTTWTVAKQGDWFSVAPPAGSNNGSITITAQPNSTGAARSATVVVEGAGVDYVETVYINQGAAGGNANTELAGTWYHNLSSFITDEGLMEFLEELQITLNADGTYTGEIPDMDGSNEGNTPMTWEYSGGLLIITNEDGETGSYRATRAGRELIMEAGIAGQEGYAKILYTDIYTAIPAMPASITPYTGSASLFTGKTWKQLKVETCYEYDGEPYWHNETPNMPMSIIINADGTWTGGTWTYEQATGSVTLTYLDGSSQTVIIDASSTASTLVYASISEYSGERTFSRVTYSLQ